MYFLVLACVCGWLRAFECGFVHAYAFEPELRLPCAVFLTPLIVIDTQKYIELWFSRNYYIV